jgi:hypothetical protein
MQNNVRRENVLKVSFSFFFLFQIARHYVNTEIIGLAAIQTISRSILLDICSALRNFNFFFTLFRFIYLQVKGGAKNLRPFTAGSGFWFLFHFYYIYNRKKPYQQHILHIFILERKKNSITWNRFGNGAYRESRRCGSSRIFMSYVVDFRSASRYHHYYINIIFIEYA